MRETDNTPLPRGSDLQIETHGVRSTQGPGPASGLPCSFCCVPVHCYCNSHGYSHPRKECPKPPCPFAEGEARAPGTFSFSGSFSMVSSRTLEHSGGHTPFPTLNSRCQGSPPLLKRRGAHPPHPLSSLSALLPPGAGPWAHPLRPLYGAGQWGTQAGCWEEERHPQPPNPSVIAAQAPGCAP